MNQAAEIIKIEDKKKPCLCTKNQEPEIDKNNVWQDDLLGRKQVAEDFTKIIETIEQPFVVSIDAPYGFGKSFFLKRWEIELNKEYKTVYFNAWNSDFCDKPLVPFMYNILEALEKQGLINKEDKSLPVFWSLLNNGVKFLSRGVVDLNEISDAVNKDTRLSSNTLEDYKSIIANINDFKDVMRDLLSTINGNLYIFVDELERCRPTFAVELLECIKHLFNIPKIVFILGIDRMQLKHTISNIYGDRMDGEGYLRRFIDLELKLPKADVKQFTDMLVKKFNIINSKDKHKGTWTQGFDEFVKFFRLLNNKYKLSLREIEQCFTEFNIISKLNDEEWILPPLLALLIILRTKNYEFYDNIEHNLSEREKIEAFVDDLKVAAKSNSILQPSNQKDLFNFFENLLIAVFLGREKIELMLKLFSTENLVADENFDNRHYFEASEILKLLENQLDIDDISVIDYLKSILSYLTQRNY